VSVGAVTTLTAEPRDETGQPVSGQPVYWSSSDTTVAVVLNGVVTARSVGEAQIAATVQGVSAVATIVVSTAGPPPPPPATQSVVKRVEVTPAAALVRAGGNIQFRRVQLTAVAFDQDNRIVEGRTFTWTSSDASKATVTADGLVTGQKEGSTTITATTAGIKASSSIVVVK
jgi:uncharacterized protein YjdB